jgi:hypothetical protein
MCRVVLLCLCVSQDALIRLDDREAEEARQKEAKKREAEAALKVGHVLPPLCFYQLYSVVLFLLLRHGPQKGTWKAPKRVWASLS